MYQSYWKLYNVVANILRTHNLTITSSKIKSITNSVYLSIINSDMVKSQPMNIVLQNVFNRFYNNCNVIIISQMLNITEEYIESIRNEIIDQTKQSIMDTTRSINDTGYLWLLRKYLKYERNLRGDFFIDCFSEDLTFGEIEVLKDLATRNENE